MEADRLESAKGVFLAFTAYLIWGLSVIYWKSLKEVNSFEILMHRMIWSFVFLVPFIIFLKQKDDFFSTLRNRRKFFTLLLTTIIVGGNWFVFIWAINKNMILQTSLGYYINPIVNVFLGMVFLKERLRKYQKVAVFLAFSSVLYLAIEYGQFPWISLFLAFSFGFYALIKKVIPVNPLTGLSVETLLLSVPAVIYLLYIENMGKGAFLHLGAGTDLLLMGTALVTAAPLLLFTKGAKILNLSTIGFLQYIAPTCTFLIAIFIYKEPLAKSQLIAFTGIWSALALYSYDAYKFQVRNNGRK